MRLAHIHTKDADNRFNPRICKRCDKNTINYGLVYSITVSIHASVKDATKHQEKHQNIHGFNPRICKRCDSMFVKSFIDDTFKL